jgi:ATPase subunit of ABC transporter with duplicated ATPase domains
LRARDSGLLELGLEREHEAAERERLRKEHESAERERLKKEHEAAEQQRHQDERTRQEEADARQAEIKRARAARKEQEKAERAERARKAREADPDSPVVNGHPVPPKVADSDRYFWENPTQKGSGIDAHLAADGTLSAAVKAVGPERVRGRTLFDLVFKHFGDRIKRFKGEWGRGKFDTNYNEFVGNLATKMSLDDAARNTWTGRLMAEKGFGNVTVPPPTNGVYFPIFSK